MQKAEHLLTNQPDLQVVRRLDLDALAAAGPNERVVQRLIEATNGTGSCTISWIRTPAGGGSPEGLHIHPVDQIFYLLEGTMTVEVSGVEHEAGPGSLLLFPAQVPHRNWNSGQEPTVHLAINAPAPDPDVPFVERVASVPGGKVPVTPPG
jgi:quercetin dioxygenase-like cupin family protein